MTVEPDGWFPDRGELFDRDNPHAPINFKEDMR